MRTAAFLPAILAALFASLVFPAALHAEITPARLRCEYQTSPLAVETTRPRLFWIVQQSGPHSSRSQRQSAYQIRVARSAQVLANQQGDLWDTGKVQSAETTQIPYAGKPLDSGQSAHWSVRVWDGANRPSAWSRPAIWTAGLLRPSDWKARWIGYPEKTAAINITPRGASWIWMTGDPDNAPAATRFFRRRFTVADPGTIVAAHLLAAADDRYVALLNGKEVLRGSSWENYQSADIKSALRSGENELWIEATNESPGPAGLLAKITIRQAGQSAQNIVTDSGWTAAARPEDMFAPARVLGAYGRVPWGNITGGDRNRMLPAPYFRKEFTLAKPVRRAILYISALGMAEARLNGQAATDDVFAPGWTDYRKRVYYRAYDVTGKLKPGRNGIGLILGDGWYGSFLGFTGKRRFWEGEPLLKAQMNITFTDGATQIIHTDSTWKTQVGPIRHADLLMGCAIDFQRTLTGWDQAGYNAKNWPTAQIGAAPKILLEAHPGLPMRVQQKVGAVTRTSPRPGIWIYDLGQNLVGWARIKVSGKPGQTITVRHGERLTADGNLYTANLRAARATDTYTLAKNGPTVCEPKFTFHGFQYVEITGTDSPPAVSDVAGIVVHSDLPRAGTFTSDNPLLNRLALNTDWGQIGNYIDVPTDCPQRDERLGWTGDAQVFAKAAAFNRDIAPFFTKWLVDLIEDGQFPDGSLPDVAPSIIGGGNAAWEDAGVICVYRMLEMYGDTAVIRRYWPFLTRFMNHLARVAPTGLRDAGAYGDWLLLDAPQQSKIHGTAYYYQCARLMAEMATAIGDTDEAARYKALAAKIKRVFQQSFVTDDGRVADNGKTSQTFYALALGWDLLPVEKRGQAAEHLAGLIQARDGHLATGFIGTPVLLPALRQAGRTDIAYQLLLGETYPSWLYQVKLGATTMWERWDGWTPEKGFQDPGMNSFNHYWLGCVTEWLHTAVGGVDTDGPGFHKITIRPETDCPLQTVRTTYDSIRGTIVSSWQKTEKGLTMTVTIPANVTATVYVPATPGQTVTESGKEEAPSRRSSDRAVFAVGSGTYRFVVR